ncbi:MAG: hypothetical protein RQ952_01135 [Thermoproteota archaeon]|jgi:uncharacterized membrane protein|nr:hypothetical protein [Thermoproteota archaeon]
MVKSSLFKTTRISKAKYILIIGITLVFLSILISAFALEEYSVTKKLSGSLKLNEGDSFSIDVIPSSFTSYAYVYNGSLYLNSTGPLIITGEGVQTIFYNQTKVDLRGLASNLVIRALKNDTTVSYNGFLEIKVKPYYFLSIPSIFILIVGMVFSFMGVYQFIIEKKMQHY